MEHQIQWFLKAIIVGELLFSFITGANQAAEDGQIEINAFKNIPVLFIRLIVLFYVGYFSTRSTASFIFIIICCGNIFMSIKEHHNITKVTPLLYFVAFIVNMVLLWWGNFFNFSR